MSFSLLIVGVQWPAETFLERKFAGLAAEGVRLTVAASGADVRTAPPPDGVRVVRLTHWQDPIWRTLLDLLRAGMRWLFLGRRRLELLQAFSQAYAQDTPGMRLRRLVDWLRLSVVSPDVVHFEWNSIAIEYDPLASWWGCPMVVSCRGADVNIRPHLPGHSSYRLALSENLARAAMVQCVSQAMLDELDALGIQPAHVRIIRPAVDTEYFFPFPVRDPLEFRLVSVGSLIWRKGYPTMLRAVRRLVDEGIPLHLDIIGAGPQRQRLMFYIDDLELHRIVFLHGELPPARVLDHLQQSDVFILSSVSEGISNAVIEAMSCGLPVVTCACGGMQEAVQDGVEGLVVPLRDPQALARALIKLWEDKDLRGKMGQAARARALAEFDMNAQTRQLLEMYQDVLAAAEAGQR